MTSLFKMLIETITALFLGVSYIPSQDKPFLQGNYFQTDTGYVNYLQIYNATLNVDEDSEKCNTGKFMINTTSGRNRIQDEESNGWLFYTGNSITIDNLITDSAGSYDDALGAYVFEVPTGTEIISPYDSTLVNESLNDTINTFPANEKSMGIYTQVVTDQTEDGSQFRLTFGSIYRHWCCMSKTKPEYVDETDTTTAYFKHSDNHSGTITFNAGDVIAEAGVSGMPANLRGSGSSYIFLKVEKKMVGSTYMSSSLKELYNR